jgi:pilus assembly protein Flp/PilA
MLSFLSAYVQSAFSSKDDEGATAVEYGLMVALIAVAIITTVGLVGTQLDALFEQVRVGLGGAAGTP